LSQAPKRNGDVIEEERAAEESEGKQAGEVSSIEVKGSTIQTSAMTKSEKKQRGNRKQKKQNKDAPAQSNGHPNPSRPTEPSSQRAQVRFGSDEEPPAPVPHDSTQLPLDPQPNDTKVQPQSPAEESDEDEAPESTQNVSELNKIKAEALRAAQAQESEKLLMKRKRKEKEARLRDQAESRKKKRKAAAEQDVDEEDEVDGHAESVNMLHFISNSTYRLPALLPQSILNASPPPKTELPPTQTSNSSSRPKKVPLTPKPPKDIVRGKTTFRVLEVDRQGALPSLPPKSSKKSKNIRENWLRSLRGVDGGSSGRVKMGRPLFVRK
jgi:hypothetical protein